MEGTIYRRTISTNGCTIAVKFDHGGAEKIPVDRDRVIDNYGRAELRGGVRVHVTGSHPNVEVTRIGVDQDHRNALERLSRLGYDDGPSEEEAERLRDQVQPDVEPNEVTDQSTGTIDSGYDNMNSDQ